VPSSAKAWYGVQTAKQCQRVRIDVWRTRWCTHLALYAVNNLMNAGLQAACLFIAHADKQDTDFQTNLTTVK
jgi:hypothetical protein